jgi:hypothetical protein
MNLLAYDLADIFWSMLYFFLFLIWIYLFVVLLSDLFRSHDLSGWSKALWVIFFIVFPLLGALAYLIIRGQGMAERQHAQAQQADAAFRSYVKDAAGTPSTADEVAKLADLHARGVLDDGEYQRLKARAVGA